MRNLSSLQIFFSRISTEISFNISRIFCGNYYKTFAYIDKKM